mmetsp:Transcript_11345/g.25205  ORF Transcript_11345/g.25205 Transcript_11345/m.25205 type:complete len:151 (-) Transcript_11345:174-626(-)
MALLASPAVYEASEPAEGTSASGAKSGVYFRASDRAWVSSYVDPRTGLKQTRFFAIHKFGGGEEGSTLARKAAERHRAEAFLERKKDGTPGCSSDERSPTAEDMKKRMLDKRRAQARKVAITTPCEVVPQTMGVSPAGSTQTASTQAESP